jgi:hypothetical protein
MDTIGSMRAQLDRWTISRHPAEVQRDAINDAVEELWKHLMIYQLSLFLDGPVDVTFTPASEAAYLVTISDPAGFPIVTNVFSGALPLRSVSISFTLCTESGSETLESGLTEGNLPANYIASVASPAFAEGALGWNLYAGTTGARRCRQNEMPLRFGEAYIEPDTGFVNEPEAPSPPVENTTADDLFYIRRLELLLSTGGYKTWEQADLDSEMMRRASSLVSGTSQFQYYYWDLINQRQIELRPAAGAMHVPRFFYVKKPRRARFDNALIPFDSVTSIAFVRYYALSLLAERVYEYQSADRWMAKANVIRQSTVRAVLTQNTGKNQRITPYMTGS